MTTTLPSHAMLVTTEEAEALLSGGRRHLRRPRATELRMRVGLLRDDGLLLATALLVDASTAEDRSVGSEWRLSEVEPLPQAISITPAAGPLWRRLRTVEREVAPSGSSSAVLRQQQDEAAAAVAATPSPSQNDRPDVFAGTISERQPAGPSASLERSVAAHLEIDEPEHASVTPDAAIDDADAPELPAVHGGSDEPPSSAPPSNGQSDARERAFAYVPDHTIDVDEAYRLLVRLRDTEIKRAFPDVRPEHGILRRTMLQALLDTGVASIEDYDELIPAELKRMTDRRQAEVYLDPLIEILSRVA